MAEFNHARDNEMICSSCKKKGVACRVYRPEIVALVENPRKNSGQRYSCHSSCTYDVRRKVNYDHLIAYTDRCCYMEKKRKADGIEAGKLDE